ncbi:hypothetical protein D3C75_606540 [compost metagenome]
MLLERGEQEAGLPGCVGGDHIDADHRIRLWPARGRAELGTVDLECLQQQAGGKVGGKAERQPHGGRQLGAVEAGPQQPDRQMQPLTGHRLHGADLVTEVAHQFAHVRRKVIHLAAALAAQRLHGALIRARRATETEIDAIRVERGQGAKLLGDNQRGVVRQHDAAGPQPQCAGGTGQMADQDRGGGAGDPRHVVVLRQPVAVVAPALGMPGQILRMTKRLGRLASFGDGHQIQDGIGDGRHGTLH